MLVSSAVCVCVCVCVSRRELQQTLQSVSTIQEEKESLFKATEELQIVLQVRTITLLCFMYTNVHSYPQTRLCLLQTLQTVSKEKEQTTVELQERERLAMDMEEEKHQLEEATTHLKAGLIVSASPLPLCSPSFALAPKGAPPVVV